MKKISRMVVFALLGMLLLTTSAVAAEEVTHGKNARGGLQLGREVTRSHIGSLLKLELDALKAERQAGKSFVQIAEERGISAETLIDSVTNFRVNELDKAVAEGKITEEQAQMCIAGLAERVKANMERLPQPGYQGKMHGKGRWSS
ncbi:MAG: hypothetical protein AB1420_14230 [Bacillota bacterium]